MSGRPSAATEMSNTPTLVERLRAAGHDERLSTGLLYLKAADRIEELEHQVVALQQLVWNRQPHNWKRK